MLNKLFVLCLLLSFASTASALSPVEVWAQVAAGEAVVLMRHARAPGTGDPDHFRLGDCSTQRNLDESGRAQARAIGDAFRAQGITQARVLSSQWCRCLETAELLGLGEVEPLPTLNSFFEDRSSGPAQTAALQAFLADLPADGLPVVMVTHQVNITALTAVYPSSGDKVAVRRDGTVLGRLPLR